MIEWFTNIALIALGLFTYDVIKYFLKKRKQNKKSGNEGFIEWL